MQVSVIDTLRCGKMQKIFQSRSLINAFLCILLSYFLYHTVAGHRGLMMYFELDQKIAEREVELSELQKTRTSIEAKVHAMYPQSIDLDLLDEIARRDLGLIKEDEHCFIIVEQQPQNR
jgi:cell division protein FtsB